MTDAQQELIDLMKQSGIKITRENYIDAAWGEPLPEWDSEKELELPEELQDWSLFEPDEINELQLKKGAYPHAASKTI